MDLSNIKLVVTDLDGTLLNSNHEVSPLFFELFESLKQHNILFVAASGRPSYSITEKLHTIKDDIIIVAENGGMVISKDKLLLSTPIDTTNLMDIVKLIDDNNHVHPVYCTASKAYFSKKSISNGLLHTLQEYYPKYSIIEDIKDIKEDIIKIALYHSEDSEKHIYPLFKPFESQYKIKVSGKNWVDISDELANKGHAINMLQENYNITEDETLIFGDYNNDIEMLKLATYSFAMENAHDNVLAIANHKTKSNDDFGVEYILDKLIKAKL
ncbi:MAG: HAD family hydrolase [Algibacter sp.]|uniref:HAD family hydrolase n=1 Tax=Algibacter sp. TaxID=1872428 RepID=UPI0032990FDD